MARAVSEWIGKTADSAIPPRVRLRIFDRQGGCCDECGRKLGVAGERVEYDHETALINGGENRESNIRALCTFCHAPKTKADVAVKSKTARVRKKRLGFTKSKNPIRGGRDDKFKRTINRGTVLRSEDT